MLRSPREEYETLERLKEPACLDFGSRILRFPFALTFYTFPKNRYADVLPYEQTRVRLERLPEMEDSDYINANYITDGLSVHIATQAPLPSTICDFWRMVFQENSPVVVMLTDFVEDGVPKADIYWPDTPGSAMRVVGNLFVSLLKTERLGSMTLRTLLLSTGSHQEARLIYHVQQHGWRDFAAPSSVQEMGALLHLVDQCAAAGLTQELDGPIVVHCSAGCGRTGVFIAIHQLLRRARLGEYVNVMESVSLMRKQRTGMVQNFAQYQFIHTFLAELLGTEQPVSSLSDPLPSSPQMMRAVVSIVSN